MLLFLYFAMYFSGKPFLGKKQQLRNKKKFNIKRNFLQYDTI